MKVFYELGVRAAPAVAGALVTLGVAAEYSEPIALGIVLGGVSAVELLVKFFRGRVS